MLKSNCSVCGKKARYGMLLDNYLVTPTDPSSII